MNHIQRPPGSPPSKKRKKINQQKNKKPQNLQGQKSRPVVAGSSDKIRRFPSKNQVLTPAAERLRQKKLRNKMRKRRQRRRILMLLATTSLIITGIILGTRLLFQVNGVRIEIGEEKFHYVLPSESKSQNTTQSEDSQQQSSDVAESEQSDPSSTSQEQPPESTPEQRVASSQEQNTSDSNSNSNSNSSSEENNNAPVMRQGAKEVGLQQEIAEGRYKIEDIVTRVGLKAGQNMLELNSKKVQQAIEQELPYLEEVAIKYRLPNTILVQAELAKPAFVVKVEETWALISAKKKVLEILPAQPQGVKVLFLGKVAAQVGYPIEFLIEPEPIDEATILAQENISQQQKLDQLEQAKQKATQEAELKAEKRKNNLTTILELLEKWNVLQEVTAIDVSNELELQFWYQERILVKLGTENQLDYKIQFAAEIVTKQLSTSDRGTLNVSNIREDGELRPVFSRTII